MATFCIPLVLQVQAETETEAHQIGEGAALHLQETYNDNGTIIEAGAMLGTGELCPHCDVTSPADALRCICCAATLVGGAPEALHALKRNQDEAAQLLAAHDVCHGISGDELRKLGSGSLAKLLLERKALRAAARAALTALDMLCNETGRNPRLARAFNDAVYATGCSARLHEALHLSADEA